MIPCSYDVHHGYLIPENGRVDFYGVLYPTISEAIKALNSQPVKVPFLFLEDRHVQTDLLLEQLLRDYT
jgi:hypothetical protein